jgi:hypothetical protein
LGLGVLGCGLGHGVRVSLRLGVSGSAATSGLAADLVLLASFAPLASWLGVWVGLGLGCRVRAWGQGEGFGLGLGQGWGQGWG